ncbi:MAG: hypothetical protein ACREJ2_00785 [Planctomycetota bacterium]
MVQAPPEKQPPTHSEENLNWVERTWAWFKDHPRLVVLCIQIIPVVMLLFGFAVIVIVELKAHGVLH